MAGALAALALYGAAPALSQELRDARHGNLLYDTHCTACHTGQVHWRDHKLATNWDTLVEQVNRWQGNTGLRWNSQDIADVAQYLNDRYYKFPAPVRPK